MKNKNYQFDPMSGTPVYDRYNKKTTVYVGEVHGATETVPGDFKTRGRMRYFFLYTKATTEPQARHIFEEQLLTVGCVLKSLFVYTHDHWLELEEERKAWKKAHPKVSKNMPLESSSEEWIASLPAFYEKHKSELVYDVASQEDASLGGTLNVTLYPESISRVYMVLYDKTGMLPDCTLTIEQVRKLKAFLMAHEI